MLFHKGWVEVSVRFVLSKTAGRHLQVIVPAVCNNLHSFLVSLPGGPLQGGTRVDLAALFIYAIQISAIEENI